MPTIPVVFRASPANFPTSATVNEKKTRQWQSNPAYVSFVPEYAALTDIISAVGEYSQSSDFYDADISHSPSTFPYLDNTGSSATLENDRITTGSVTLPSEEAVEFYASYKATQGGDYRWWQSQNFGFPAIFSARVLSYTSSAATLEIQCSGRINLYDDALLTETYTTFEIEIAGTAQALTPTSTTYGSKTTISGIKAPDLSVHSYGYQSVTNVFNITVPLQATIRVRAFDPYGRRTTWQRLAWRPVAVLSVTDNSPIYTADGSGSISVGAALQGYKFYRQGLIGYTPLQASPSYEFDLTDFVDELEANTSVGFFLIANNGIDSLPDTETINIEPASKVIGHLVDKFGDSYAAVKDPNNANNVQLYRFKNGVASRETLANIANAKNPRIVKDRHNTLHILTRNKTTGVWEKRKSTNNGASVS